VPRACDDAYADGGNRGGSHFAVRLGWSWAGWHLAVTMVTAGLA